MIELLKYGVGGSLTPLRGNPPQRLYGVSRAQASQCFENGGFLRTWGSSSFLRILPSTPRSQARQETWLTNQTHLAHRSDTHTHIHIVVMTNKDVSIYSGQVQWPVTQGFIHVISLSHCPGNRRVRFARTCWMSMMLWASRGVGKHSGLLCKMWKTRCQRIWSFQSTKTGKPCISCVVERNESSLKIPSWNRRSSVRRTPAFLTWQMERHRLAVFVSFRWLMMLKALRIRMRWVTIRFIQPQLVCPVQVWCSTNVDFVK